MSKVLVLSIKPEYAAKIYSGEKRFEFRKAPPRNLNATYLIYESSPVSKITGYVTFNASITVRAHAMASVISDFMSCTKRRAVEMMGISEKQLLDYAGNPNAFVTALMIGYASKDSAFKKYKIRPPQNWGTVCPQGDGRGERL